ncbi:MAG: DNA primase DnaG [Candidatus Marsarchaeota archaeon]|nr:DNA primase DnaG [Candidatus Marsarchaeota archaeon]MCL5102188.1 DNA primase DnaG [Candidatus Marsarchaeota archaeon]
MAKTYIDIVKYMIEARFEISGSVEKPDIIGAIFGQTEGLLGPDLDLRELQKNGKIGRIEIESGSSNNKTYGKLLLPSSLGKVETCILAAAIESVDRVGPFETNFKIDKIDDTRNEKRAKVINRAKELVKSLLANVIPDSKEISEMVEADVKSSTVTHYGPDNLPSGPDVAKSDSVIIVEGRADVVNLLKSDITNCIAVGGATGTIPKTIIDLCAQKEVTLFVDGDRGGDIIFKGISNVADIDYIAKAPDGKEVEELTRKEIIKALRSRVPYEQTAVGKQHAKEDQAQYNHNREENPGESPQKQQKYQNQRNERDSYRRDRQQRQADDKRQEHGRVLSPSEIATNLYERKHEENNGPIKASDIVNDVEEESEIKRISFEKGPEAPKASEKYVQALGELKNTLRGRLYDQNGNPVSEIPIRDLIQTIQETDGIRAVVFDGIITQRLIELAYGKGVREIYGIRSSQITKRYDDLLLYTREQ